MKIKYQGYWAIRKQIKKESHSVSKWDTWNETKNEKKVESGNSTSEDVAKINHEKLLGYEVIIFNHDEDEFPSQNITLLPKNKHVGVDFIDPGGRKYLTYLFTEIDKNRKLFLREVWYYHFTTEEAVKEDYRINFSFNEDGDVSLVKYDDKNQKLTEYEGKEPVDVKLLYEEYPEFGKYEGIIKENREIPFLKKEIRK